MIYLNYKSLIISYFRNIHDYSFNCMNGAGGGIRTHDHRFRRPMLYPTELLPHNIKHLKAHEKAPKFDSILYKSFHFAMTKDFITGYDQLVIVFL